MLRVKSALLPDTWNAKEFEEWLTILHDVKVTRGCTSTTDCITPACPAPRVMKMLENASVPAPRTFAMRAVDVPPLKTTPGSTTVYATPAPGAVTLEIVRLVAVFDVIGTV